MKTKKICFGVIFLTLVLSLCPAWGAEWYEGLELGVGGVAELSMGEMSAHEKGNAGAFAETFYPLPLGLPEDGLFSSPGLFFRAGFLFPLAKASYVDSWWLMDFSFGAWCDIRISSIVKLRPELAADFRLHSVASSERGVEGLFFDSGVRAGIFAVISPFQNGLSFKTGADYVLSFEKECAVHSLGASAGMLYRF